MPPQSPEHFVVTLLRQSYITPRCQASQFRRHTLPNSYTRTLSTTRPPPSTRYRQAACLGAPQRCSPIHTSASDELYFPPKYNLRALNPEPTEAGVNGIIRKQARIAVLGGGITGLASAHYLAREIPNAQIVVYEGSKRLGGWLNSQYIDVDGEKVLLESGPRTLRPHTPAGLVALELVRLRIL